MCSLFIKITYILPFPTTSLEQSLGAIWSAVSWAAVLILPPIKLNSQLSTLCFFFFFLSWQAFGQEAAFIQILHWDCSMGRRPSESRVERIGRGQTVRWPAIYMLAEESGLTPSHGEVLKGIQQGGNTFIHIFSLCFPGGSAGEESTWSVGDLGLIPGLGRFLEKGMANHYSFLAWRILSRKELDTTWATFTFTE